MLRHVRPLRPLFLSSRSILGLRGSFLHQVRDSAAYLHRPVPFTTTNNPKPLLALRSKTTMPLTRSTDPLVWIDCEMTGLDPEKEEIIQICCFITDAQLNLLEPKGFETIIKVPDATLDAMSPWCVDTHGRTGLTAAVRASTTTPAAAADQLLAYVQRYVPPRTGLLAGNSVHADKAFLVKGPYAKVMEHLHYRILDVSTIKEAARRWGSEELLRDVPPKKEVHLARDDILESIAEMRYYKEKLFG